MSTRKPPIKCTPCRVTVNSIRYRIYEDGSVSSILRKEQAEELGLRSALDILDYEKANLPRLDPHHPKAREIRREASRLRRNRNARERNQAMRDLGMVKTPLGWE